ncbi:hypothetical protein LMH87_004376 [Akanthomyces muscarius]|uniref:Uncharacterized protein n=1 Tax=Akanthomyces muscarius TaxID=2231603 RepID=A0A9W8UHK7_AKAMU|nr:hypothetical protein LMH87_004376 [Akanthomyces muscarius]KAJ4145528.1 hypothetical protein LMH87_004376 [Akanthomyces muscarius]
MHLIVPAPSRPVLRPALPGADKRTIMCLLYHHTLPDIGAGAEPICTPQCQSKSISARMAPLDAPMQGN